MEMQWNLNDSQYKKVTCNESCFLTLILHSMLLLHVLFTQQAGPEGVVTHGTFERLDVDNHVAVQAAVGGE